MPGDETKKGRAPHMIVLARDVLNAMEGVDRGYNEAVIGLLVARPFVVHATYLCCPYHPYHTTRQ